MINETRTPNAVRLVAALFILSGLLAIVDMVLSLLYGGFHLSLGIIGLFVGVGLLRERPVWRTWGLVLIWIALVSMSLTVVRILGGSTSWTIFFFGRNLDLLSADLWMGFAWIAAWFVISLWQYRVLTRPDVRLRFGLAPKIRLSARGWALLCCTIPLLFILMGASFGFHFSALQSARTHFAVPKESVVLAELDLDWGKVHIFEGSDVICTVGSYRAAFVWRSPVSSSGKIRADDAVSTVGYLGWILGDGRQVTVFAVQTTDPNVAAIEAGSGRHRLSWAATPGTPVIFQWAQAGMGVSELSAKALNSEGHVLYEYRYAQGNILRDDELLWYPLDVTAGTS